MQSKKEFKRYGQCTFPKPNTVYVRTAESRSRIDVPESRFCRKERTGAVRACDELLLRVLTAALRGEPFEGTMDPALTEDMLKAAEIHGVLALVVEAAGNRTEAQGEALTKARTRAVESVVRQLTQENEFLTLVTKLRETGHDPVVIKGSVCRQLYPRPCLRPSVDEDVLVPETEFAVYHDLLTEQGLFPDQPDADLNEQDEASYHKKNSPLYIEVHKKLFSSASEAYGDCNLPFEAVMDRLGEVQVQDMTLRTLGATDHLLYLILHAFKHFLHSGFGIRMVCDIALFARAYGKQIDWDTVTEQCRRLRAEPFAAALFHIASRYLDLQVPALPEVWLTAAVKENPLLEDILAGGLYGTADENRLHSSNITLAAAEGKAGLWRSLFPGKAYFHRLYPYTEKHPVLMPAAWVTRIFRYLRNGKDRGVTPAETVKTGKARVKLLELYGIVTD